MSSNKKLLHDAAKDGYLQLLNSANRHEVNKKNEDGLTPTMCAAANGNLEALRILISRGADPDRTDNFGWTALHHAAANGTEKCLRYLITIGANLWSLDNQYKTAMDIAGQSSNMVIVEYLDEIVAQQSAMHKKSVRKFKENAKRRAEKRIKKYEKILDKLEKQQERKNKLSSNRLLNQNQFFSSSLTDTTACHYVKDTSDAISFSESCGIKSHSSSTSEKPLKLKKKLKPKFNKVSGGNVRQLVEKRKINQLKIDDNSLSSPSRIYDLNDKFLNRPDFGENNFSQKNEIDNSDNDSIGTAHTLADRLCQALKIDDDIDITVETVQVDSDSKLKTFLNEIGLLQLLPILEKECVDDESILLLDDKDLIDINIPLGYRKKLLAAINKVKNNDISEIFVRL